MVSGQKLIDQHSQQNQQNNNEKKNILINRKIVSVRPNNLQGQHIPPLNNSKSSKTQHTASFPPKTCRKKEIIHCSLTSSSPIGRGLLTIWQST